MVRDVQNGLVRGLWLGRLRLGFDHPGDGRLDQAAFQERVERLLAKLLDSGERHGFSRCLAQKRIGACRLLPGLTLDRFLVRLGQKLAGRQRHPPP